jgi:hypothetical protein
LRFPLQVKKISGEPNGSPHQFFDKPQNNIFITIANTCGGILGSVFYRKKTPSTPTPHFGDAAVPLPLCVAQRRRRRRVHEPLKVHQQKGNT